MRNTTARIKRQVSIALMLAVLTASLTMRVPTTLAEQGRSNRDSNSEVSNLWPINDPASTGVGLTPSPQPEAEIRAQVNKAYGKLPLSFELNQGQSDAEVKFLSRGAGYTLFLTPTEAVWSLRDANRGSRNDGNQPSALSHQSSAVLRMRLVGSHPDPNIVGEDQQPGRSNYLKGNDRSRWQRNVPLYSRVRYTNVYAGVDMLYYGSRQQLEYDFIVAPGADPKVIALDFEGVDDLSLDTEGNLVLRTGAGEVTHHAPVIYQETDGVRQPVSGHYIIKDKYQVGFEVAAYDRSRPLMIDPVVQYSTYLGGDDDDERANGVAVDAAGHAYVTGETSSSDFPSVDAFDSSLSGPSDAFITKFTTDGSALVYSTQIGGNLFDVGNGIAVTADGKACITGLTGELSSNSQNSFPVTSNALQDAGNPNRRDTDAFVTVLTPDGGSLVYSTFYGGASINEGFGLDQGNGIAVDSTGKVYITGTAISNDLKVKNGFQRSRKGLTFDAFIAKFNPSASTGPASLLYASYLGGSDVDQGNGIAVDKFGVAYVVGRTDSDNFPTKSSSLLEPFQKNDRLGADGFIAKISPAQSGNSSLTYSTYLGGSGDDEALAVAVDASQRTYITGVTGSQDFPLKNPFDTQFNGGSNAFVTKMNADGTALFYSSLFGGNGEDQGAGIAVDSKGNAYVAGTTGSSNGFPVLNAFQPTKGIGDDAFVAGISAVDSTSIAPQILFSSFLGGNADDAGHAIALGPKKSVLVAGETVAVDFPTTAGAFQKENPFGSGRAAFITRIAEVNADTIGAFSPADLSFRLRNSNTTGPPDITIGPNFYQAGDIPLTGDFDGDGIDTSGIFRPANSVFLLSDRTDGSVTTGVFFGQAGDLPITGDWDGDGKDGVGVFRPSAGKFFLRNKITPGPADITVTFGAAGDTPLAGDWDGDGDDTIGVFRNSNRTFLLRNKNSAGPADITVAFGAINDLPITGDWDGDGDDTIGVFRGSTKKFFLRNVNAAAADVTITFGATGDVPLAGDWDGLSSNTPPNSGVNEPSAGSSAVGQAQQFVTTCSDPDGWRNIRTIDFKIAKVGGQGVERIAFWAQFDQNRNRIRLYNPDNRTWSEGVPGSNRILSNRFVRLRLPGSMVEGSGPTGPSVRVTWNVVFDDAAALDDYQQYLRIEDDAGYSTNFDEVGAWSVSQ
jgi:hypothetical protein